jgi:methionyl aminopeptidase
MNKEEISSLKKAGSIIAQVKEEFRSKIKNGMLLLEIAESIESRIIELGAKPAFPVNLSINEIAAHATPSYNDESLASGLLKVDLGAHINGFCADTAFSLNLSQDDEESKENLSLIKSAESALEESLKLAKMDVKVSQIGSKISETVESFGFSPIKNLSGHSISQYDLHAGETIPNFDNSSIAKLEEGTYAIEPFTTLSSASGIVKEGKPSGIYHLEDSKPIRDSFAREVLKYIAEEYKTLPFCSRWIHKKFGTRGLLALRQIEASGSLHHYKQLVESSGGKVAQAEHTILVLEKETIVTTL